MKTIKNPVKILWTSGWDSTFRLLQLLIQKKVPVKPYYLIDNTRKSSDKEIDTMARIRNYLFREYPDTKDLLFPTEFFPLNGIKPDPSIAIAWEEIKKSRHIGTQYKWLAGFCKQHEITEIELSVQKRDDENSIETSLAFNLANGRLSELEQTIFKYFSFPLLNLSKSEMKLIAEDQNWMDVLSMTWFCHHPLWHPFKGAVPCGDCRPCIIAAEEGFGWRIPAYSKSVGSVVKRVNNTSVARKLRSL